VLGGLLGRAAVGFAVRYPRFAALLGVGASAESLALARQVGSAPGGKLIEVLGPQVARTAFGVLRGRQPLDALSIRQRQLGVEFFRGVAERAGGKFGNPATQFNLERARFLEGTVGRPPGTLAEFMAREGFL